MSLHVTRPELGIIEPCLPSPANAPPSGTGWLHEIKHDGFRIMARRGIWGLRARQATGRGAAVFGASAPQPVAPPAHIGHMQQMSAVSS